MPNTTYPYSDNAMDYKLEDHRYVLKAQYFWEKTGIDLHKVLNPAFSDQPQMLAEHWLDQISIDVYNYVYDCNADNPVQEYWLAKTPSLRDNLRDAMVQQAMYVLKNGDLNMYAGVDLKTGKVIQREVLTNCALSPNATRILNRIVPELGISITFQGKIVVPIGQCIRGDY